MTSIMASNLSLEEKVREMAGASLVDMTAFLRRIVADPGECAHEKEHAQTIYDEMVKLGFDDVHFDPLGNVMGFMGKGPKIIAFDAHIDNVGIGLIENWEFDPYKGFETASEIGGRGTTDQLGGIVSAIYGTKIMNDLGLIPDDLKIMIVGSVQEEDCEGMSWDYILNEDKIRPEFVISTEPTDGGIYRGHRGRMEIRIDIKGISAHGSAPERGVNAIYRMADVIKEIEKLNDDPETGLARRLQPEYNDQWEDARFLGRGTVVVSQIFYTSPSRCAVADSCAITLDRRMTAGETWEGCLEELRELPSVKKLGEDAVVSLYRYEVPSYTGVVYPTDTYFPAWIVDACHPSVEAARLAYTSLYGNKRIGDPETLEEREAKPLVDKWDFSTNAVTITGRYGIPCVGFGPGAEKQAHAPNEKTWKQDLVVCAATYALIPQAYAALINR